MLKIPNKYLEGIQAWRCGKLPGTSDTCGRFWHYGLCSGEDMANK
jgi:hypothetical protein